MDLADAAILSRHPPDELWNGVDDSGLRGQQFSRWKHKRASVTLLIEIGFIMRFKVALNLAWISLFAAGSFINSAAAQVVLVPHGDYENDFEKYLVVTISLVLLCFAALRYYRSAK